MAIIKFALGIVATVVGLVIASWLIGLVLTLIGVAFKLIWLAVIVGLIGLVCYAAYKVIRPNHTERA